MANRKAIIIGASSGIGRNLAGVFSRHGYEVGLTARREALLFELQKELSGRSYVKKMDIAQTSAAREILQQLIAEMQDVDVIVINAGVSSRRRRDWEIEKKIIDINVAGFVAIASAAMEYFNQRGSGHIVGISSVASLKGFGRSAAYSASKAFISTYMQGLRQKSVKLGLNITVTDIKPGYVASEMTEKRKGLFWTAPAEKAAKQIYNAIEKKKNHAYVTRRWRLAAWTLKAIPDWLFIRLPV